MARPPRRRALRRAKVTRKSATLVKQSTYFFPFILSFFALFIIMIAIGSLYLHHRSSLLSFEVTALNLEEQSLTGRPVRVKIPSAHIDALIKGVKVTSVSWPTYEDALSYVVGSGQPGESGTIIIYAPDAPSLFGNLDQVKVGDVVTLITSDNKQHEYLVQDSLIVSPEEGEVLHMTNESLVLFTSSGFLNAKRLVIKATPIKVPTF